MYYNEDLIDQIRQANDIVDVIGQYVKLTKKGANYFGLCPFHGEKTPSFSVSPQKQIFYCFGCGAGGDVVKFLMEYENYTFTEALKYLAERAHIALPESGEGAEEQGRSRLRMQLYEINKEAAFYYYKMLHTEAGKAGYAYFREKRALSDRTITHFGLGFSDKTPDDLYRYLKDKQIPDELLRQSGLFVMEEKGIRDKFWNRVMFPIMDTNNRVVGFGGRVMGDGLPKYLNSPETPVFDKSSLLYGLNFARRSKRKFLLLCEGYMDVIALHQAGFTNAVASLGTAFNEKHARLLKRYTDEVILTQDSDAAGVRAKLRAFPILRDAGLSVKVLTIPGYKDPDELIRAEGADAYETCIKNAKNAFQFEIDTIKRDYDLSDPAMKTRFYDDVASRLCMFEQPLERDNYIQAVSRWQMIPYEELKQLVNLKILRNGAGTAKKTNPQYDPDKEYLKAERDAKRKAAVRTSVPARAQRNDSSGTANDDADWLAAYTPADFASADMVPPEDMMPVDAGIWGMASQAGAASQNRIAGNAGNPGNAGYPGYPGMPRTARTAGTTGFAGKSGSAEKPDSAQYPSGGSSNDGSRFGQGRTSAFGSAVRSRAEQKTEETVLASQRLLLSWFCARPDLIDRVMAYLEPEDFSDGVFREVAEEILRQHKSDAPAINAAAIMDRYSEDDARRRQAGAILNADIRQRSLDDMSSTDLEKALSEAVRNIRKERLRKSLETVGNDLLRFQELMKEKTELERMQVKL